MDVILPILSAVLILLNAIASISVLNTPHKTPLAKTSWILCIWLVPLIGVLFYGMNNELQFGAQPTYESHAANTSDRKHAAD